MPSGVGVHFRIYFGNEREGLVLPVDWRTIIKMKIIESTEAMKKVGAQTGALVRGGEMIELIGDVGTGKTTFTKGLGEGMGVDDDVQSPSFTIEREYHARDGLQLHHYDFYRLSDPGVVKYELAESIANPQVVTVVEWGETAQDVLPDDRIVIRLTYVREGEARECDATVPEKYTYLAGVIT